MRGSRPRPRTRPRLRPLALAAAALLLAAGCRPAAESRAPEGAAGSAASSEASDLSAFGIRVVQGGGFAAMRTTASVDGATLGWTWTTGRMCAPGADCPAADSASGTLAERDVRALERLVAAEWTSLDEDYGRTPGAADVYDYEIELRHAGRTKRITGDDLALPAGLRAIRDRLFQAIDAARGR